MPLIQRNKKRGEKLFPVKSFMTTDLITVKPEMPIFDAIRLLPEHQISGLPVVDDEMNLKGILSELDVLEILNGADIAYKDTVAHYMTTKLVTFTEQDNAFDLCRFFQKSHIRRVPIVRNGKLVGIVSRRDLVNLILEIKDKISDSRFS